VYLLVEINKDMSDCYYVSNNKYVNATQDTKTTLRKDKMSAPDKTLLQEIAEERAKKIVAKPRRQPKKSEQDHDRIFESVFVQPYMRQITDEERAKRAIDNNKRRLMEVTEVNRRRKAKSEAIDLSRTAGKKSPSTSVERASGIDANAFQKNAQSMDDWEADEPKPVTKASAASAASAAGSASGSYKPSCDQDAVIQQQKEEIARLKAAVAKEQETLNTATLEHSRVRGILEQLLTAMENE
jgi:hypothetical protein